MSEGAQALYLHLGLNTDTIGALTGARRLAGSFGLSDPNGAFSELVSKGYLIEAEQDGESVYFLSHWWVNNTFDTQKAERSAYLPLAQALFESVAKGEAYRLKAADSNVRENLTSVSNRLPNSNGNGRQITKAEDEANLTEGNANESEGKGNGRGSPKGEPPKPIECPRCHEKTLHLFLEQEHPQAQCINCRFVTYIDPDSGELSQLPFRA